VVTEYSIKRRQTHEKDSFTALKQQALGDIQQLAGKRWTDYNLHDPGITLLEQLCFSTAVIFRWPICSVARMAK
jgi:hypothetical protein